MRAKKPPVDTIMPLSAEQRAVLKRKQSYCTAITFGATVLTPMFGLAAMANVDDPAKFMACGCATAAGLVGMIVPSVKYTAYENQLIGPARRR